MGRLARCPLNGKARRLIIPGEQSPQTYGTNPAGTAVVGFTNTDSSVYPASARGPLGLWTCPSRLRVKCDEVR